MRPKILAIGGQTASGKSSLAILLAKKFNGEIINADSRQVYRYLDIGTAKEEIETKNSDGSVVIQGIVHYLIDILDPNEEFNLAKFQELTLSTIKSILQKGKLPILVGGTGLYLDSIVYNYNLIQSPTDNKKRASLQNKSVNELQNLLKKLDTNIFQNLNNSDKNNPHRLIRAIERQEHTKDSPKKNDKEKVKYQTLYIAPLVEKEKLNERIDKRVDEMFIKGLEKENQNLREKGYSTKTSALKSIGYQEFDQYFNNKSTLEETKRLIKLHTKQYAKRQKTWFKRNKDIYWIKLQKEAINRTSEFLDR